VSPVLRAARALGAGLAVVVIVAAGVGWLYTVRDTSVLAVGPRLAEALPLQRLARTDAQPLLSLVVVWLATGLGAGTVLAWMRARGAAAWAGTTALAVLVLTTAASDAVTESQRLVPHLAPQIGRPSVWCAATLVGAGAAASARLLAVRRAHRGRTLAARRPARSALRARELTSLPW